MNDEFNKNANVGGLLTFKNISDVHKHLKANSWKISRTQIYDHAATKKLNQSPDGTFSISAVEQYALKYLRRADGSKPSKVLEDIQVKKYDADVRQAIASAEMKELKIKILRGEYVRKDAFSQALVERAMLFKYDIETFCRSKATDIVNLASGNPEKIPDVIEFLLNETAKWLATYSEEGRSFTVPMPSPPLNNDSLLMSDDDFDDDENDVTEHQG